MSPPPGRTALYRVRGDVGALLYIGITNGLPVRWNHHMRIQPWWDELRSLTVDWYETRTEAEEAEKAAVMAELPKYNLTYLVPRKSQRAVVPAPKLKRRVVVTEAMSDVDRNLLEAHRLYRSEEVEALLGLEVGLLDRLARTGGGPVFYDLPRTRMYVLADVRDWQARQRAGAGTAA